MEKLQESLLSLVVETSTNLPPDVRRAMARAMRTEDPGTRSSQALLVIASNIDMAKDCEGWDPLESTCRHASLSIL